MQYTGAMNETLRDQVHQSCARLRFSTPLRRHWQAARAEAAVWDAQGICALSAIPVSLSQMRQIATQNPAELPLQLSAARGIWAATWNLVIQLPDLNQKAPMRRNLPTVSWPQTLATWHRLVASALGLEPALPSDAAALGRALTILTDKTSEDAIIRAARVCQSFYADPPFSYGNEALAVLAAKRILVLDGVEPTAVAPLGFVLSWRKHQDFWALCRGNEVPVEAFCAAVVDACEVGEAIGTSVFTSTPLEDYPQP